MLRTSAKELVGTLPLVLLWTVLSCTPAFAQIECAIRIGFIYPPIARLTRAQGVVEAAFVVDNDGAVVAPLDFTGPSVFLKPVRDVVEQSRFASSCAGPRSVSIEFRIRETVSYKSESDTETLDAAHYRVSIDTMGPILDLFEIKPKPSLARRVWRAIFRR